MGPPGLRTVARAFRRSGLQPEAMGGFERWPCRCLVAPGAGGRAVHGQPARGAAGRRRGHRAGADLGPADRTPRAFSARVNAGFLQVVDRAHVRLRVYERGAGETLACGTGACAAVVAGIRLGCWTPRGRARPAAAPHHRVARQCSARRPGPHDRTGHLGVRGRDRCPRAGLNEPTTEHDMSNPTIPPITEDDIANYLANTPDFFERHAGRAGGGAADQPARQPRGEPAGAPGRDAAREDQGPGAQGRPR
jgi:hypothetical protein